MKNRSSLYVLLFLVCFFTTSLFGQDKGLAIFLIKPYDALLKIDGAVYDLSKESFPFELALSEGNYEVQIWATNYKILKIPIVIKANRSVKIARQLQDLAEDYKIFQVENTNYRTNKWTDRAVIAGNVGVTLGYALLINKSRNKLDGVLSETEAARSEYAGSVSLFDLENTKRKFNFEKDNFKKQEKNYNNQIIIGGIGLGVIYGLTTLYFKKRRKIGEKRPVYEAKNPFANLSFDLNTDLVGFDKPSATQLIVKWSF